MRVRAPARLHFGFLDLNGGLGRRFGSIGLALDAPVIALAMTPAVELSVDGPEPERVERYVRAAANHLSVPEGVAVRLYETIPPHAGFGSGTQLALALAAGLAALHGRPFAAEDAGAALDRGARSGVGVAAFLQGGLIVDGGRGPTGGMPPVISRLPFPDAWRVVLVLDEAGPGVHGPAESTAFRELPTFPDGEAAQICRIVLMTILPAAAEADLPAFGRGVAAIQRRVGDFFAPFQGGGRYTSPVVADALAEIEKAGVAGVGQSSWGPTGFAVVGSQAEAEELVRQISGRDGERGRLRFMIARGRNRGADVTTDLEERPRIQRGLRLA